MRIRIILVSMLVFAFLVASFLPCWASLGIAEVDINDGSLNKETPLGNLVTDAMKVAVKADIALLNSNSIGGSLKAGSIDEKDLIGVVFYPDDYVVAVHLTGKQIIQALEKSVSMYPKDNGGFLQVSGIRFTFSPSTSPRVGKVEVGDIQIDKDAIYTVAITESLAQGFLGYEVFLQAKKVEGLRVRLDKALIDFVKTKGKLNYSVEERIKIQ